jgi:hypothetical protein
LYLERYPNPNPNGSPEAGASMKETMILQLSRTLKRIVTLAPHPATSVADTDGRATQHPLFCFAPRGFGCSSLSNEPDFQRHARGEATESAQPRLSLLSTEDSCAS